MASPAVNSPIDPAKQKRYPIIVSEHLLGALGKGRSRSAVLQCRLSKIGSKRVYQHNSADIFVRLDNHKPNLSAPPKEKIISQSPNSGKNYNLSIKGKLDGEDYVYTGSQQPSEALALVYSPQTQTFTLDKISADFAFNLRSTPSNKNAKSLATQYPHLPVLARDSEPESTNSNNSSDENDGANVPSSGADSTNPYDYRHFLSKRRRTSSLEPLAMTPNMPRSPPRPIPPAASPPRRAPARPKPKPRPRPAPKRAPSPADADNEDSDDGVLTIEMEPDTKTRRIFKPKFKHDPRNGPISLRSAASASASPAALSPTNGQQSGEDEDVDIMHLEQTGGAEDVEIALTTPGVEEEEAEEAEEAEEEVEAEEGEEGEEGEDYGGDGSLEAELEYALEQADGEDDGVDSWANNERGINRLDRREAPHVNTLVDDSSSESEEE